MKEVYKEIVGKLSFSQMVFDQKTLKQKDICGVIHKNPKTLLTLSVSQVVYQLNEKYFIATNETALNNRVVTCCHIIELLLFPFR